MRSRLNSIPVRRGVYDPKSIKLVIEALDNGGGIIMFPEGTRGNGKTFLPPKPGIGLLAKKTGASILPVYASGTNKSFKAIFRAPRMKVIIGNVWEAEDLKKYSDDKDGYRAIASEAMNRIGELRDTAIN